MDMHHFDKSLPDKFLEEIMFLHKEVARLESEVVHYRNQLDQILHIAEATLILVGPKPEEL